MLATRAWREAVAVEIELQRTATDREQKLTAEPSGFFLSDLA